MSDVRIPAPAPTIAEAFAAMPLEAPDRSAWPLLAARIDAAQKPARAETRFRRWLFAGAAAAAIGAVALLPREIVAPIGAPVPVADHGDAASPATAVATTGATPADIDALMAESAQLEYLLDRKSTRLNSSHSQISYAV